MIKGAPFWNDRSRYYVQTNNPTEQILKKEGKDGWLESCGSTALTNCAASLGKDFTVTCPGGFQPQTDEIATGFLNDPRNFAKLVAARPDIDPSQSSSPPGNRIPQYFPLAAREIFGITGKYQVCDMAAYWGIVIGELLNEHPVELCLKIPGHYIAAVAYDLDVDEIIINDSWPGRFTDGLGGFNRRLTKAEIPNLQNFIVVYQ
jgi:hypothetical protein